MESEPLNKFLKTSETEKFYFLCFATDKLNELTWTFSRKQQVYFFGCENSRKIES